MGKKKKIFTAIAVGIVIIFLLDVIPIPNQPVSISPLEYIRNYFISYNIELPRITLTPPPEINITEQKLAFARIPDYDYGSIYVADCNGQITLLKKDIRIRGDIAWSPDGEYIALVCQDRRPVDSSIHLLALKGGKINRLIQMPLTYINSLDWSPDGSKILFEGLSYQQVEKKDLSNFSGGIEFNDVCYAMTNLSIYIFDVNQNTIIKIVEGNTNSRFNPVWSPDSQKIAFVLPENYENAIYIFDINETKITKLLERANYPAWSPDGKKIAFVSYNGKEISIFDITNCNITKLLEAKDMIISTPLWLPDGQKIVFGAFSRDTENFYAGQIYTVNIDGSNLTRLTNFDKRNFELGKYYIQEFTCSNDGQKIAFTIYSSKLREGGTGYVSHEEVYLMNIDGTNLLNLGEGKYLTWSPL